MLSKKLQKGSSIKVLGADKSRATVVIDTEEYEKLATMLSTTKTYKKLDKDPTPQYKKKKKYTKQNKTKQKQKQTKKNC